MIQDGYGKSQDVNFVHKYFNSFQNPFHEWTGIFLDPEMHQGIDGKVAAGIKGGRE